MHYFTEYGIIIYNILSSCDINYGMTLWKAFNLALNVKFKIELKGIFNKIELQSIFKLTINAIRYVNYSCKHSILNSLWSWYLSWIEIKFNIALNVTLIQYAKITIN